MHLGKVHFCRAGMPPGAPPQSRERLYISGVMGAWWAVRHACGAPHDSSCAWCPTRLVMRVVPHTTRHARGAPHDSSCAWCPTRLFLLPPPLQSMGSSPLVAWMHEVFYPLQKVTSVPMSGGRLSCTSSMQSLSEALPGLAVHV